MQRKLVRLGLIFTLIGGILLSIATPAANALSTLNTLGSGFTWAGSKSATLSPTTGWTQIVNSNFDDNFENIALGWNITFEGISYNTVQVHSNTYITFANGGVTSALNVPAGSSQYSGLTPNSPTLPGIHMCSKDNSYQSVWYRFENSNTQLRVRYEGNNSTSGTVGASTIIYEAVFTQNSSVIDIGMGVNSSCDSNSGLLGVTAGTDAVLEAYWPTASYSSGYTISTATGVKNNDYRLSAGPTVSSFTSANSTITNTSGSISYSLVISEAVSGLAALDFSNAGTATGCIFSPSATSGTSFTITISSCSEGTLKPQLLANAVLNATSVSGPPSNSSATSTINIDRTSPSIASVTAANGNYSSVGNPNLNLTVIFNESVTVSGAPRIGLTIGTTSRFANFISMSDSRTASFRFTVSVDYSDIDLNGIAVTSPMETNSATITDLAANVMTNFAFTTPVTTSVNVYQPPSAPIVDSITANNASLTIFFTPGAANGSVISNYKYSLNGGTFTALSPIDFTSPITISGLTNGSTYSISIKAVSNLGDGLASNSLSSAPTASASVSINLTASATTAVKGSIITITAQVNQAGLITFYWNGKRIAGCLNKRATTSASCQWKPSVTGQASIQAILDPTDSTYITSASQKLPVFILKRTGNR